MKRILSICAPVVCLVIWPSAPFAGDINQPTHLPNRAVNKITQVRLLGLTAEEENEGLLEDELSSIGIGNFNQSGCNLNVGNSIGEAPGLGGDRDVIINGDVINVCK